MVALKKSLQEFLSLVKDDLAHLPCHQYHATPQAFRLFLSTSLFLLTFYFYYIKLHVCWCVYVNADALHGQRHQIHRKLELKAFQSDMIRMLEIKLRSTLAIAMVSILQMETARYLDTSQCHSQRRSSILIIFQGLDFKTFFRGHSSFRVYEPQNYKVLLRCNEDQGEYGRDSAVLAYVLC